MSAIHHFPVLTGFLLSITLLMGCNSGSDSDPDPYSTYTGSELPPEAYLILKDFDDINRYEQYFVVRKGGEWEFVEFGFTKSTTNLVQLTRHIGVYALDSGKLKMQITHKGDLSGKGILSTAQVAAFPFSRVHMPSAAFHVRNIGRDRFDGEDLFIGAGGWKTYQRTDLPMSMTAPSPLPREFEAPLLTAPDTVRLINGESYTLDLTGGSRNPKTAWFYFSFKTFDPPDSNTTGRFPVSFPEAGYYKGEAWARGTDGGLTPGVLSIVFEVASLDPDISVLSSWRFKLNDTVRFETRVVDAQGDLTEVIWDFNGDGTVDFRSDSSASPTYVYTKVGDYNLTVTARDRASHVKTVTWPLSVTNDPPHFDRSAPDTLLYIGDAWKVRLEASDGEKNLVDSVWWDFMRDGTIDTITRLSAPLEKRFDSLGTFTGWAIIKDELGEKDSLLFRIEVQGHKKVGTLEFNPSGYAVAEHGGRLWAVGGKSVPVTYETRLWTSIDGITWTVAARNPGYGDRYGAALLSFQGKLWLFNGGEPVKQDVWTSTDGQVWNQDVVAPKGPHALVYQNKLWVFGVKPDLGTLTDVWNTADGIQWTRVGNGFPAASSLGAHCLTVFEDKLILLLPRSSSAVVETYQTSNDGITWTPGTWSAPWVLRSSSGAFFEFNGNLWLAGGNANLWSTSDGTKWTRRAAIGNLYNYWPIIPFRGDLIILRDQEVDIIPNP